MKEIVILGGPNGAGKTTAAKKLLPKFAEVQEFLNANEFARAIAPDDPESAAFAAGRKMLERMQELIESGASFGIESTLSGRSYIRILERSSAPAGGSQFCISGCQESKTRSRVLRSGVKEGGHGVAPDVIRRYLAGSEEFREVLHAIGRRTRDVR